MTGAQLFEYHSAFRDFSGSDTDDYAQDLETAVSLFGKDKVFNLLEQAERESKKIELIEGLSVEGEPTGIRLV